MTERDAKLLALRSMLRAFWRAHISDYRRMRNHAIAELESVKVIPMLSMLVDHNTTRLAAIIQIETRIQVLEHAIVEATAQLVSFKV